MKIDANCLREYMKAEKIGVHEFAELCDLQFKTIYNILNGHGVYPKTVKKICAFMLCEPSDILLEEDTTIPSDNLEEDHVREV